MAAVASSALRNWETNIVNIPEENETTHNAHLDKRVIFFVVALNSQDRIPRTARANVHLNHLGVEEICQVLLVDIGSNASNVQSSRLTRKVGISANPHPKALNGDRRGQSRNTQNRRNLSTIGSRKIEEP
jgi:hypothetical protein